MARKPVDALTSFVFLTDNLPTWIQQLDELSTYTTQKRSEFAAEYRRLLNHIKPRKQKTPSVQSAHGSVEEGERPASRDSTTSSRRTSLEISPLEAGNRHLFATARARKTKNAGSSVRSQGKQHQKFRNRHMVVVHYDSHTQSSFESMVKNIAAARNNLRKGRQSRELSMAFDLSAFTKRNPLDDESPGGFGSLGFKSPLRNSPLNPKSSNLSTATSETSKTAPFDVADKDLEKAKDLCETAAHQFLRDGDCSIEIGKIKETFESVLDVATTEADKLKQERDEEENLQKAAVAEQEKKAAAEAAKLNEQNVESQANGEVIKINAAQINNNNNFTPVTTNGHDATTIEVDDDDGSEISVDLTAFRSTRANGRGAIRAMR
ncbi:MAG: hypothetical protein Q9227_004458 [Pyrenula ochraceoflavens]